MVLKSGKFSVVVGYLFAKLSYLHILAGDLL